MIKEMKPNGAIVLEDFNEGDGFYKVNLAYLNREQIEEIENIVNKWNSEPEDKELLLKYLCTMVPYEVICSIYRIDDCGVGWRYEKLSGYFYNETSYEFYFGEDTISVDDISKIKPYLRPMSSMTEEEKEELLNLLFDKEAKHFYINGEGLIDGKTSSLMKEGLNYPAFCPINITLYTDWLNARHFDYRGLIEKGLAIEAPEGMYDN